MGDLERKVTAVIINYQTPDLTRQTVELLRKFYPKLLLLLIDNGSKDESVHVLRECQQQSPSLTQFICNSENLYHGPAMHQALQHCSTEYVLFLDSDCEVIAGDFIEGMLGSAERDERCYAVGKQVYMNKRGFDVPAREDAIPYIRPICMLIRKSIYSTLRPFSHHGTPCLENMRDAVSSGFHLVDFPIFDYIVHQGRGTANRYGYGLGFRGKLNYLLNKLGL